MLSAFSPVMREITPMVAMPTAATTASNRLEGAMAKEEVGGGMCVVLERVSCAYDALSFASLVHFVIICTLFVQRRVR
ncbi:hypothetical protein GCM10011382_24850 [Vreelandella lutescens]|uniref:Uncharacterized protein n=1 Tax=Vreelandella lutescens TaxID=1602943 RepID=A0ABQ1PAY3_9GAMM|nr:hypothetical protein GCM10011382_24850 [Halomonas lutescens]